MKVTPQKIRQLIREEMTLLVEIDPMGERERLIQHRADFIVALGTYAETRARALSPGDPDSVPVSVLRRFIDDEVHEFFQDWGKY